MIKPCRCILMGVFALKRPVQSPKHAPQLEEEPGRHLHEHICILTLLGLSSQTKLLQADLTGVGGPHAKVSSIFYIGVPLFWETSMLREKATDLQIHCRCFRGLGRQGCPKDQGGYAQIQGSVASAMKGNQPPKQSWLVSHSHSHQGRLQQLQRSKAQPGGECNLIAAFGLWSST